MQIIPTNHGHTWGTPTPTMWIYASISFPDRVTSLVYSSTEVFTWVVHTAYFTTTSQFSRLFIRNLKNLTQQTRVSVHHLQSVIRHVSLWAFILKWLTSFSVYNTPYLLKVLINNRDYNYLVMKSDRKFIEFGYKEVYRSGSMRVLKRLYDDDEEKRLRETASAITLGECARILKLRIELAFNV